MKRIFLTLIVCLSLATLKAQTVCAGGRQIKLTEAQVTYLKSLKEPCIDKALATGLPIKNNTTADLIIKLVEAHSRQEKQIAKN